MPLFYRKRVSGDCPLTHRQTVQMWEQMDYSEKSKHFPAEWHGLLAVHPISSLSFYLGNTLFGWQMCPSKGYFPQTLLQLRMASQALVDIPMFIAALFLIP